MPTGKEQREANHLKIWNKPNQDQTGRMAKKRRKTHEIVGRGKKQAKTRKRKGGSGRRPITRKGCNVK